jgi:hypothetical protein
MEFREIRPLSTHRPNESVRLGDSDGNQIFKGSQDGGDFSELCHGNATSDASPDQLHAVRSDQVDKVT